jgi:TolB protein
MVVNADGSELTNITGSPDVFDFSPSWSPTGRHIVWAPSARDLLGNTDLWRMRATGAGRTVIAVTKRLNEYQPDWANAPV